jgi:peptidyl-prolyl cis-trans isomerase SurA
MKTIRWSGLIGLFFAFTIITPHALRAEILNRVVAVVDDEVITLFELNTMIKNLTGFTPEEIREKDEVQFFETRKNILDLMVDDRIAQKRIQELGIVITEGQIDSAIENRKKNSQMTHEDLLNGLKREGLTYEKYRESIKKDLERQQLINAEVKSKILIREEQITQYYEDHYLDYTEEEELHLAGIFLIQKNPKDRAELGALTNKAGAILNELNNGKKFQELAKVYSQGPGAEEGGDLGIIKTAQLDKKLREIIHNLSEGDVSRPIQRGNGIQIFKLIKRSGGYVRSLEEVKDSIYDILYRDEINNQYMTWIKNLRESTYTKIIL